MPNHCPFLALHGLHVFCAPTTTIDLAFYVSARWLVELVGAENTVYADERYFLKFRVPEDVRQTVDPSFARHPGGGPHGN